MLIKSNAVAVYTKLSRKRWLKSIIDFVAQTDINRFYVIWRLV